MGQPALREGLPAHGKGVKLAHPWGPPAKLFYGSAALLLCSLKENHKILLISLTSLPASFSLPALPGAVFSVPREAKLKGRIALTGGFIASIEEEIHFTKKPYVYWETSGSAQKARQKNHSCEGQVQGVLFLQKVVVMCGIYA